MKRSINTFVSVILLVAYLQLGVVGHLVRWTANGGWGQNGQQVNKGKPLQPAKVSWKQSNHLAPAVKNSVPVPAILPTVVPTSAAFEVCGRLEVANQEASSAHQHISSARAPPLYSTFCT